MYLPLHTERSEVLIQLSCVGSNNIKDKHKYVFGLVIIINKNCNKHLNFNCLVHGLEWAFYR